MRKFFHLPRRVPDPTSVPQVAAVALLFTGNRERGRLKKGEGSREKQGQQQQFVIAHFDCSAEQ